ncbi:hypothetical protein NL526_27940, partial [Klebsiella pneumoniae]|nr:hypothetical protein [Klebsiella pneumoniae]
FWVAVPLVTATENWVEYGVPLGRQSRETAYGLSPAFCTATTWSVTQACPWFAPPEHVPAAPAVAPEHFGHTFDGFATPMLATYTSAEKFA